jgi:hypothetical protein
VASLPVALPGILARMHPGDTGIFPQPPGSRPPGPDSGWRPAAGPARLPIPQYLDIKLPRINVALAYLDVKLSTRDSRGEIRPSPGKQPGTGVADGK